MERARRAVAAALFFACAISASAQQEPSTSRRPPPLPPGSKTGNPTPGTPQPDPPNLADRITVVGCVQKADHNTAAPGLPRAESRGTSNDPNTPSDARFVLARAERKQIVPPGTGTSSVAASVASSTFRLYAIDSQLSPFVGARVEISGEVLPSSSAGDGSARPPVVQVEFVQKLSATCS